MSQNRVRMSYRSQLTRFYSVLESGELKLCPQRAIVTMDSLGPVMLLSWVILVTRHTFVDTCIVRYDSIIYACQLAAGTVRA